MLFYSMSREVQGICSFIGFAKICFSIGMAPLPQEKPLAI